MGRHHPTRLRTHIHTYRTALRGTGADVEDVRTGAATCPRPLGADTLPLPPAAPPTTEGVAQNLEHADLCQELGPGRRGAGSCCVLGSSSSLGGSWLSERPQQDAGLSPWRRGSQHKVCGAERKAGGHWPSFQVCPGVSRCAGCQAQEDVDVSLACLRPLLPEVWCGRSLTKRPHGARRTLQTLGIQPRARAQRRGWAGRSHTATWWSPPQHRGILGPRSIARLWLLQAQGVDGTNPALGVSGPPRLLHFPFPPVLGTVTQEL